MGDYIVNDEIVLERKSAADFVQSVISGRLFAQCANLRKTCMRPLILIEGNPFQTSHNIDKNAVKGALLSVAAAWQIPLLYSENHVESASLLCMLSAQTAKSVSLVNYSVYKPKRCKNHHLRFLQGLPKTGPVTASRLLEKFGSIQAVINADVKALQEVNGIGKTSAEKIKEFLSGN